MDKHSFTKTILRAASFEVIHISRVPIGVISAEYVAIANSFLTEGQPGLVNALIDALANKVRKEKPGGLNALGTREG